MKQNLTDSIHFFLTHEFPILYFTWDSHFAAMRVSLWKVEFQTPAGERDMPNGGRDAWHVVCDPPLSPKSTHRAIGESHPSHSHGLDCFLRLIFQGTLILELLFGAR